jgi:hypothetical protein
MESTVQRCSNCPLRAKYDRKPRSFAGRFWRWHINFCPGWKAYFSSLTSEEKDLLREKYHYKKGLSQKIDSLFFCVQFSVKKPS